MSAITIAYGPSGSGKSTAAREWLLEDGDADLQRVVIDEATFGAAELRRVDNLLDGGTDVWLNYLTDDAEPALPSFPNHDVTITRFELAQAPLPSPEEAAVNADNETLFAKVALEVSVYLGRDAGTNFEPPEDYLVAREAEMVSVEFFADPGIGILVESGAADDFDCDNAIVEAAKGALIPTPVEPAEIEIGELRL